MPTEVEEIAAAKAHYQAGRWAEGEQLCRRVLDANPWHAEALYLVGFAALQSGRLELAVQYIGQAVVADGTQPAYHCDLGRAYQALDAIREARACYEQALRLVPHHPVAGVQLERLARLPIRASQGPRLPLLCTNASHQYRVIFIHVPKNAGSSIKRALDMPGGNHPTWRDYATYYPQLWSEYTSFAVVRNPWDRAVSAYQHARMRESLWQNERLGLHPDYELLRDKSFDECVSILYHQRRALKHLSWFEQAHFVADCQVSPPRVMVGAVLRHESLAADFAEFCRRQGIDCQPLPTVNDSPRARDYRGYYNDQTREMIREIYRADVETFGYSF
jgi:tetratricopeptide (TPR) repeat protein